MLGGRRSGVWWTSAALVASSFALRPELLAAGASTGLGQPTPATPPRAALAATSLVPGAAGMRPSAPSPRPSLPAEITLYGRSASFGDLAGAPIVPSGQKLATTTVPNWGFHPGQAAFNAAVGPDGQVFIANEPQTDNQLAPTARDMVVSVFDPAKGSFTNIVVPTTTGAPQAMADPQGLGGADVSDLRSVGGRMALLSAVPYHGWDLATQGEYPTFGYLAKGQGGWLFDPAASHTATDLGSSSPQGRSACSLMVTQVGRSVGDCRGAAAMAVLPSSGDVVVAQYFDDPGKNRHSGGLMVLAPSGLLVASYAYPNIAGADGALLAIHPREVDADPTSSAGDERFVVVFDVSGRDGGQISTATPFTLQEFSFSGSTIVARSLPIVSGDTGRLGRAGFETAKYDGLGNLWAAQTFQGSMNAGSLAVYLRSSGGGRPSLDRCAANTGWRLDWGRSCPPDLEFTEAADFGVVRSLTDDPATGAMLVATMAGYVVAFVPAPGGRDFVARSAIDLGLDRLVDRNRFWIDPRRGAVDVTSHRLWLPIQQLQSPAVCAQYPCPPKRLDQWLVAIDLNQALA